MTDRLRRACRDRGGRSSPDELLLAAIDELKQTWEAVEKDDALHQEW